MSKNVFLSYSWDSVNHEEWVLGLAADLRRAGINANLDKTITQTGNVNLDRMMIDGIKNNDKVVMILTEKYAEKSDNNIGGVGFETLLSIPTLKSNPDKLVLISRHNSNISSTLPFHLKGYYAIDFSNDNEYFNQLNELIHKIREVNMFELPPVAEPTELTPKIIRGNLEKNIDTLIPNLKDYSDDDKDDFLRGVMLEIWSFLNELSVRTNERNSNFTYKIESNTENEKIIYFYMNNVLKTGIHIRLGKTFGRNSQMLLSYGMNLTRGNLSSFNDMISCEIDSNNEMTISGLTMSLSSRGKKNSREISESIWKEQVLNRLKY